MGYAHCWRLEKDLDEDQWRSITRVVQRLADTMPQIVTKGPFVQGVKLTWSQRWYARLWRRDQSPPFRSEVESGSIMDRDGRAIVVIPGGSTPIGPWTVEERFVFPRTAHTGDCKTNAKLYDRLVIGTLMVVQRTVPGALIIEVTDMEPEHQDVIDAWINDVMNEPIDRRSPDHR